MVKYIALLVIAVSGYLAWTKLPIKHGPGITAKNQPQLEAITWEKPFEFKSATLTPKKKIEAQVRVVNSRRYFFDTKKVYSPLDAYVSWNKMSDENTLEYLFVNLEDRSYNIEITRPPISLKQIHAQSDLWHLIPSNDHIYDKVTSLRTGSILQLKGLLVDVKEHNSKEWTSAKTLNTEDKNEGFIIWVQELNEL